MLYQAAKGSLVPLLMEIMGPVPKTQSEIRKWIAKGVQINFALFLYLSLKRLSRLMVRKVRV